MTRRLLLFLSVLALSAPNVISYTLQQTAGAPAQTAGVGTIQGMVVRQGTNEPIPDARITVVIGGIIPPQLPEGILDGLGRGGRTMRDQLPQILRGMQGAVRGTAVSDRDGRFTISNVPAGTQSVRVELEGYFGPEVYGVYMPFMLLPVTVTANQTASVKASLLPAGTITGRVVDSAGKPVSEAGVHILFQGYENGAQSLQEMLFSGTDDRGAYRLYPLPPGDYYLAASPLPPALLAAMRNQPPPAARGNADPAGQEVQVPTFYPSVTDPASGTRVTLRPGETRNGVNIQMRTATSVKVSGRVTSTVPAGPTTGARGEPQPGVVILAPTDFRGLFNLDLMGAIPLGANGTFEFPNVAPGIYDLIAGVPVARGRGWGPQGPPEFATAPLAFGRASVDTQRGNANNVVIVARSGVDVKGRVLLDGTPTRANIRVSLMRDNSPRFFEPQITSALLQIQLYSPPIANDGSFSFPLIPEGRYRFLVMLNPPAVTAGRGPAAPAAVPPAPALPQTAYVADIRQGGTSVYDNGLLVGSETVNPVDILLGTSAGSVEVTVVGSDQKPSAGMIVAMVPAENRRQNPALYKAGQSDAQGRLTMTRVPPGSYTLFAGESVPPGAYENAEFLSRYAGRGKGIVVRAGSPTTATVTVIREDPSAR